VCLQAFESWALSCPWGLWRAHGSGCRIGPWLMCSHLRHGQGIVREPLRFSEEFVLLRRQYREVVVSGQALYACKEAPKLCMATVWRSKRAHSEHLKAALLDKRRSKNTDLHSMLRCPQRTQTSPLAEQASQTYLDDHLCPPGKKWESRPSPSDMAVSLGQGTRF